MASADNSKTPEAPNDMLATLRKLREKMQSGQKLSLKETLAAVFTVALKLGHMIQQTRESLNADEANIDVLVGAENHRDAAANAHKAVKNMKTALAVFGMMTEYIEMMSQYPSSSE